jgi:hypothetical protein
VSVSFKPWPLYPRGKISRYPLDRRLGGPQSRSGRRGEQKILYPTGTRNPTPCSSSPQPVAIPTTLSRLLAKPSYSDRTCPSATLSTTNLTWSALGCNPGRRGGKLATNRLWLSRCQDVNKPADPRNCFLCVGQYLTLSFQGANCRARFLREKVPQGSEVQAELTLLRSNIWLRIIG